jgi:hypothetical protein
MSMFVGVLVQLSSPVTLTSRLGGESLCIYSNETRLDDSSPTACAVCRSRRVGTSAQPSAKRRSDKSN